MIDDIHRVWVDDSRDRAPSFGLQLGSQDFDDLQAEFDRISEAERTAELAAAVLRVF